MPQSPILIMEHLVQGQDQGAVTANEALNILERKLTNLASLDVAGIGEVILTNDQVRDMALKFTGILTGDRVVSIPARNMLYLLENATTGAFKLDFQVIGGAGGILEVGRGFRSWVWCDGVDCVNLAQSLLEYAVDVSTTYQVTPYDSVINGDTSGGGFTITLPQVSPGKRVLVQSVGAATALTIARGGTDTIKGVTTSLTITTQWQGILFVGQSASNWLAYRLTVA